MKNCYEPAQREGINRFVYGEQWITIIHSGAVAHVTPGQVLMLRRADGLFWCGRAYNDAFMFLLETPQPVSVRAVFDYLAAESQVKRLHAENDFVSQQELPF